MTKSDSWGKKNTEYVVPKSKWRKWKGRNLRCQKEEISDHIELNEGGHLTFNLGIW